MEEMRTLQQQFDKFLMIYQEERVEMEKEKQERKRHYQDLFKLLTEVVREAAGLKTEVANSRTNGTAKEKTSSPVTDFSKEREEEFPKIEAAKDVDTKVNENAGEDMQNLPANRYEEADQMVQKGSEKVKKFESNITALQLSAHTLKTSTARIKLIQGTPLNSDSNCEDNKAVHFFTQIEHNFLETSRDSNKLYQ